MGILELNAFGFLRGAMVFKEHYQIVISPKASRKSYALMEE